MILNNLTILSFELFMAIWRRQGHFTCIVYTVGKSTIAFAIINCILNHSITQALYTTWWENLGALNDSFFITFFNTLNVVLTLIFLGYTIMFQDYYHPSYFYCRGIDPTLMEDSAEFITTWRNLVIVINVLTVAKAFRSQKRLSAIVVRKGVFKRFERIVGKNVSHPAVEFLEGTLILGSICIMLILVTGAPGGYGTKEQVYNQTFRTSFLQHFLRNTFVPIICIFLKREHLRKSALREIKGHLANLC